MPKKPCLFLYSEYTIKSGQDFFDKLHGGQVINNNFTKN